MACNTSASSIKLAAANISWGVKEKTCISPVADVAGSLNDTYFLYSSPTVDYYVWYDVNSAGTDPTIAGKTGVTVALATGASIADVISASVLAIETATAGYAGASTDGLSFYIENMVIGEVTTAADTGSTGFAITVLSTGLGGDLGRTSEGVEVTMEVTQLDVVSNQTGEALIDSIQTGITLTCSMALLEMTQARWNTIVAGGVGDSLTPAGGTEFVGFGQSKDYTSQLSSSGELVINPIAASDNTENFTFWKCLPVPSSINFSGTDLQVMNVEFRAFLDSTKDENIRLGGYGDNAQDFR